LTSFQSQVVNPDQTFCKDAASIGYIVASIWYPYTTILIKIHFFGLEILLQVMGVIEQRLVIICLRQSAGE